MDAFVSFSLGKFNSKTVGKINNFEFHKVEIHFIMPHKKITLLKVYFLKKKRKNCLTSFPKVNYFFI